MYSEETDFCLRARDAGWSARFTPAAEAIHVGGASGRNPDLYAMQVLNRIRLYRRRHGLAATSALVSLVGAREAVFAVRGVPDSRRALECLCRPSRRPGQPAGRVSSGGRRPTMRDRPPPGPDQARAPRRASATRSCCSTVIWGNIGSDRISWAAASATGKPPAAGEAPERPGQVHRHRVVDGGTDLLCVQVRQHPVPLRHPDDVEVPHVIGADGGCPEGEPCHVDEQLVVPPRRRATEIVPAGEPPQLVPQDHRLEGVEPGVEAEGVVDVLGGAPVVPEQPDRGGQRRRRS